MSIDLRNYDIESINFQEFNYFRLEDNSLDYSSQKEQSSSSFSNQNEAPNECQIKSIEKGNEDSMQNKQQIINISEESNEGELNFKNDNPFIVLNIRNLPRIDDKEQIQIEKQNGKKNNNSDIASKKTKFTSMKVDKINNPIPILFQTTEPQKRIDYVIKYFKTNFSNFLKEYGNKLIKNSHLPKNLKKLKLSKPNRLSFTGNTTQQDNYKFLSFRVEEIFWYYKNENCKISRQKNNKDKIEQILQYIEGKEDEGKYNDVKSFFKMSLEDAYTLFYNKPEYFQKYATDSVIIEFDKEFQAQKGFSLLETNGIIKLFKII